MKIAVVGAGLLGGSISLAIEAMAPGVVQIYDRDDEQREAASAAGLAVADSCAEVVDDASLVFLAIPPRAIAKQFSAWADAQAEGLKEGCIVTEVSSTKGVVYEQAKRLAETDKIRVILSHPLAGTEKSGFAAADLDLFSGASLVLTPLSSNSRSALAVLSAVWSGMGTQPPLTLSWRAHEQLMVHSSHLPHVASYALAASVGGARNFDTVVELSGGGLRDSTRIAASNTELWTEIFLGNASNLLPSIDDLIARLAHAASSARGSRRAGSARLARRGQAFAAPVRRSVGANIATASG